LLCDIKKKLFINDTLNCQKWKTKIATLLNQNQNKALASLVPFIIYLFIYLLNLIPNYNKLHKTIQ